MAKAPVTEFVGEHGHHLLSLTLLNQSVIDDNMLLPRETKEIGVAVGAALASINHVQLMQRELQLLGEILNVGLELAFFKRGELVEERKNRNRVDGNHKDLETSGEQPEIVKELVARLLDNGKETGENGRGQDKSNEVRLDHIRYKKLGGLFIESKLFLENKGVVDAGWKRECLMDEHKRENEDDRM
jgi:hypothetical protein